MNYELSETMFLINIKTTAISPSVIICKCHSQNSAENDALGWIQLISINGSLAV